LPDLPSDLPDAIGYESADGQWVGVTVTNWALLVDHVLGLQNWIVGAVDCLEAR